MIQGDARAIPLRDGCAQTVVTSPPYWGLRDYGVSGQIGLEDTPDLYVATLVGVFREVRRVLRDDGTVWLNLGDSYFGANWRGSVAIGTKQATNRGANGSQHSLHSFRQTWASITDLKPKDLIGIPWKVALALQADGWWLRSDIVWNKPNPMPESVLDRPTRSHEYIFLLAKSATYYYDADAIREPMAEASESRYAYAFGGPKNVALKNGDKPTALVGDRTMTDGRNKRSVWTVNAEPTPEAHFATFPRKLIEPCILAGSRIGDLVFDPFIGSGTTGKVAERLGRQWVGLELSSEYIEIAKNRTAQLGLGL